MYFPEESLILLSSVLKAQEDSSPLMPEMGPLLGIILGLSTASVLLAVIIVLICRINRRNNGTANDRQKYSPKPEQNIRSKFNNHAIKQNNLLELQDTKSPDIIPPSIEFTGNICLSADCSHCYLRPTQANTHYNCAKHSVRSDSDYSGPNTVCIVADPSLAGN